jgi:two-component system LytT family response regulator
VRVLIVDDEPLARERIRDLLRGESGVEAIAECANGEEAVDAIRRREHDLVFLDVQMPGLDGFEVLQRLASERLPLVIFVTAYEQYALRSFEVHPVDYLLKPFDAERFAAALGQARVRLAQENAADLTRTLRALIARIQDDRAGALDRLAVKTDDRILPLCTADIDWIEAEGNYVRLHIGKKPHLLRETLGRLETTLDARRFRRIHRSTIVNVERIVEISSWGKDYRMRLRDGTELTLSRTYADRLPEFLGRS